MTDEEEFFYIASPPNSLGGAKNWLSIYCERYNKKSMPSKNVYYRKNGRPCQMALVPRAIILLGEALDSRKLSWYNEVIQSNQGVFIDLYGLKQCVKWKRANETK